ncbi:MAG TPA: carboxypeptidase-like regulatory domain-containing protein [Pyrinomonadaceae bacterium]|nr:carboxypeptidase-like regulatory domain-containing protein [Pyrinomonadaceae bacterium]
MKRISHKRKPFLLLLLLAFVGLSASSSAGADASGGSVSTDCFRSRATGDWATPNTWESSTNCTFSDAITATLVPTSAAGSVGIQTGHTVTVIDAQSASNLTISGTLNHSAASMLTIIGTWTNNGAFSPVPPGGCGGTVIFAGGTDQSIAGSAATQTFCKFTLSKSGGTLTIGGSVTTVSINGGTLLTSGTFNTTGKTVQAFGNWTNDGGTYVGGVTLIPGSPGVDAFINGSATTQTFTELRIIVGIRRCGGSLTTLNVGNFDTGSGTFIASPLLNINISGNFIASGVFTADTSTVAFNGTNQSIMGSGFIQLTFNNLTINNTSLTLDGASLTVTGLLNLENGLATILGASRTLTVAGTATRTNGYVRDKLNLRVSAIGSYLFPVGTANGYSPVTMNATTLTTNPTTLTLNPLQGRDTSPAMPLDALNRRWTISGGAGITSDLTFGYMATDLPTGNNEAGYTVIRTSGTFLKYPVDCSGSPAVGTACVDPSTHTARVVGVDPVGTWTVGAASSPTSAGVSVSGRVFGLEGRGATNASVTMTDPIGMKRTAITNRLGQFTFEDVPAGVTYTVMVTSRRFSYAARIVTTNDNVSNLDFTPTDP